MATLRKSRIVVLAVVVLLALAMVLPVYADKPVVTTKSYDQVWTMDPPWPCSFTVTFHGSGTERDTTWYNNLGYVVKGHEDFGKAAGFFEANGHTVRANIVGPVQYTVVYNSDGSTDWSYVYVGPSLVVTIPHAGIVFGQTGRTPYVLHYSSYDSITGAPIAVGPNEPIETDYRQTGKSAWMDPTAFCAALAP
jgi:hypothetical protein